MSHFSRLNVSSAGDGVRGRQLLSLCKRSEEEDLPITSNTLLPPKICVKKAITQDPKSHSFDDGSVWNPCTYEHFCFFNVISDIDLFRLHLDVDNDCPDLPTNNDNDLSLSTPTPNHCQKSIDHNYNRLDHSSDNIGNRNIAEEETREEPGDAIFNHEHFINSDDSLKDPDFNVSDCSSTSDSDENNTVFSSTRKVDGNGNLAITSRSPEINMNIPRGDSDVMPIKRGKKRVANPTEWKASKAKKLRNSGKEYVSLKTKKTVEARVMRPPCNNCVFNCSSKFTDEEREIIFSRYWEISDIDKQRQFLVNHMSSIKPRYRYPKENARHLNNAFYFKRDGKQLRVCKTFFMATLGISKRAIKTSIEKNEDGFMKPDLRGKHKNRKVVDEEIKNDIKAYIASIPKIESHYRRADTTREFIDGSRSLAQIHRDYVTLCQEQGKKIGNLTMFSRIFNHDFNLSFFSPKKDQCQFCVSIENLDPKSRELKDGEYRQHHKEKELSRKEKERDKEESSQNVIVASYDLQAALPTPKGEVSVFYYKCRLSTYNLTVYDLKTKQTICNVWHEGDALRGSNEIATCIFKFIEGHASRSEEDIEFIFYTDNCSGQHKNKFVLSMYMYAVTKFPNVKNITHKFLVAGHTQNEGDSVHSTIEREVKRTLKGGPIFIPAQYYQLMKSAKKTPPLYAIREFSYTDIINFKELTEKHIIGKKFTQNTESHVFSFTDIKVMKVDRQNPCQFFYKVSYSDEFKTVDVFSKGVREIRRDTKIGQMPENEKNANIRDWEQTKAYQKPVGISANKKKDLMYLVDGNFIPQSYHSFYQSLTVLSSKKKHCDD